MPLYWTIDSRRRTVDVVAEGGVSIVDAMDFFDAIDGAGALSYKKLLNGTRGRAAMTPDEIQAIAVRLRAMRAGIVGALAIVATDQQAALLGLVLGNSAGDRPLQVFDDVKPARRWLEAQPSRHS